VEARCTQHSVTQLSNPLQQTLSWSSHPTRRQTRSVVSTRMFMYTAGSLRPDSSQDYSALSNDNTTPEGKEHAREQLKALGDKNFDYESKIPEEQHKDPKNVAAGLKGYVQLFEMFCYGRVLIARTQCHQQPEQHHRRPG
jgi:hypothetical protein